MSASAWLLVAACSSAAAGSWGPPVELDPSGRPGPGPVRLAVDGAGAVTAAWASVEAGEYSIRARVFSGGAWGPVEAVAAEAGPRLMLSEPSPSGDLLAAWSNSMTRRKGQVWASWRRKGRGWTPPERVDAPGYRALSVESADVSGDGRGLVVYTCWPQAETGDARLCRRLHEPGKGWSEEVGSDRNDPFGYLAPQRQADSAEFGGELVQVWVSDDQQGVLSRRFSGGKMGEPELISRPSGGTVASPRVALSRAGGFAGWAQSSRGGRGPGGARVRVARYEAGKGWREPEEIDSAGGAASGSPALAADSRGGAMAAWTKEGAGRGTTAVFASAYAPGRGWSRPELVGIDAARAAAQPELAVDREGKMLLVWKEWDGKRERLWARPWIPAGGRANKL